ncbi:3-hydroxybutyryl-CoA dehydrogenase [Aureimonas populi]|nr:3-hydroxybutyryl-CoA dehydrogenase [Aureimonas populi]
MGRGIATVFAYAGHEVALIDFKARPAPDFDALARKAEAEVRETLALLAELGLFAPGPAVETIAGRVALVSRGDAAPALRAADIVFEGFPEIVALKREALAEASALVGPEAIIASTTSTILVDDLSPAVAGPGRFLNAHWLNPAFLVPLVEIAPGAGTDPAVVDRLCAVLERIGKVPVRCAPSPGYIVPRLQSVAMNEAARLVEEGVASVEEIEKAVRYGFGLRFSVLGLLEFIDWGGGDTLYHASRYLAGALGDERYAAPAIVRRNMEEGRIGLTAGRGFLDHEGRDVPAYRQERLAAFVDRLRAQGLAYPPRL